MKILFVTLHYLYGNGGGVFASRAFANAFAELFAKIGEVKLICPQKSGSPAEDLSELIDIKEIPDNRDKFSKILHFIKGDIYKASKEVTKEINEGDYDVVVFDNSRSSYRLIDIAHRKGAKVITIHHNYEKEYARDNNTNLIIKNLLLFWTQLAERDAVQKSDLNLTLTSEDKELLQSAYSPMKQLSKIEVLGAFEYSHSDSLQLVENHNGSVLNFVITGSLGAVQTEHSLIEWIDKYYPILKRLFPQSVLTIAGKNPSERLLDICNKAEINIIANPESMEPILSGADCYICPTSLGGGLKLRIMDGLKNGLPVISHAVSARGYNKLVSTGDVLPYNDVESFEEACNIVKSSNYDSTEIQKRYREVFSFESGVARLKNILDKYL